MNVLLQIETVGPEGYKLFWVFLVLLVLAVSALLLMNRKIRETLFPARVGASAEKNKENQPETITLTVNNREKKAVVIESLTFVFVQFRKRRSFTIKQVAGRSIYPAFLEAGKKHNVVISLSPFYERIPELKKMKRLYLEVNMENRKRLRTRPVFLRSTLFGLVS
ncbi:MAG TPA: hypothetical protein PLK12_02320 [Prolixibacteraceae bacterium]|nr:hypothetical protein [Prolixibacteraceae bacterium]